jgi:ATP-binding cassette subfamily B protein
MAVIRLMTPYLGKHGLLLAFGIAGTVVNALLSFSIGIAIKLVIDGIPSDPGEGYGYLNRMLSIALPAIALWLLFDFFTGYSLLKVLMRVVRDLRDNVFSNLVGQKISYLEKQSSGELQTRLIADTNIVGGFATGQVPTIVSACISVIAGTIGALFISPKLTLIVLAAIPLTFLPMLLLGRKLQAFGAQIQQQTAELGTASGETFRSIKVVHVHNKEAEESAKFRGISDALATTGVRASRLQMLMGMSVNLTAQFAVMILLWTAARGIYAGVHTVGELMAFAYFNGLIVSSVGAVFGLVASLKQTAGSAERIMEYLSLEGHGSQGDANKNVINGDIEFKGVQFKYPARPEVDVLKGVSFVAKAGTSTVIVGPSGAGKSALFELLLGLYSPDAGTIMVDGHDTGALGRDRLRSSVGYVPQKESLISGTVFDNIAYGATDADEAKVVEAAKLACAHDFILQLPQGYRTNLGEVAARLSGGERQRISLARALIRNPRILLLDEDKSALDADSERRVSESVRKWAAARGATVISIAHRLSSIGSADRIVVVDGGMIAGCGTHSELLKGCETYRTLVSSYSRESEPRFEPRMPDLVAPAA